MIRFYKKCLVLSPKRSLHNAYIIQPLTGALEQEKQASFLTNTLVRDEVPEIIESMQQQNPDKSTEIVSALRNSIIETMFFHRDEPLKFPKRMRERTRNIKLAQYKSDMSSKVLMNMLNVIWTNSLGSNINIADTNLSYRTDIAAPWERLGEKIQVTGKIGHLISGRKLLPPFADEESVQGTSNDNLQWEDIISPFFDLPQLETVFEANSGVHPGSPFPCPQKLMALNPHFWTPTMHFGQGLFYCFAHTMNYALENGGKMGEDLERPIPMQFLSFDGTSLYFIWFQLNTLNLGDEKQNGIKNIAWKKELKLYGSVTEVVEKGAEGPVDYNEYIGKRMSLVDFDRKVNAQTLDNEQTVRVGIYDFNPEAAKCFGDFMLYS